VWNAVEEAPLARLRIEEDPQQALDALVLKGGALVQSLSEAFDREALGRLLGEVRERYSGRSLSRAELEATAEELGIPLARWLGLWLDSLEAPAFAAEGARVQRLEDAEDGTPRYQHVVRLRNDGGVAGVVVLESAFQGDGGSSRRSSDPYVVEGDQEVEIGLVHQDRAERIEVQPFFARNRGPFSLEPVVEDAGPEAAGEPWDGLRAVPYGRPAQGTVVVDDLDPGFETEQERGESWARIGSTAPEQRDLDHGLPVQTRGRAPRQWTRLATMGSWGLYRHTSAVAYTSDPSTRARFSGELPEAGPWYLEIHRPEGLELRMYGYDRLSWAEVSLSIEGNGTSREASWDASAAPYGWARVGRFEMPAGSFEVTMTPAGEEGGLIAADAIRWVPARAGENR
jgi:hypothetical protein